MTLPPGFLDELRERVSLARVAGRKVVWDARKSNAAKGDWWAPCPFHQEKTASFHVDDRKGVYYCFGCHAKGDAIAFVRATGNCGFMEAVDLLAAEAGVAMPAADPAARAAAERRDDLAGVMEEAVGFYRLQLRSARAQEARDYLARRGFGEGTQARFELGFAPDDRTALVKALGARGIGPERLAEAGLAILPDAGGAAFDRFRFRVMFPIRDPRGKAIGFGARALRDGQEPKYLNSPETPLFDKGRTLYNLGAARTAAGTGAPVVMVEGYADVIAMVQAGFEAAVAPLGTAVTEAQLALLWRLADEPVVALDGDAAGIRAALRLADLALPLLEPGRSLRFAALPAGQDPDDVLRLSGPATMRAVIGAARPLIDLLWERERDARPLDTPERRAAFDRALRDLLARIADLGVRVHYEAELRSRRAALFRRPDVPRQGRASPGPARSGQGPGGRRFRNAPVESARATREARNSLLVRSGADAGAETLIRESAILYCCLNHPGIAAEREALLERLPFRSPGLAELRDALLGALDTALAGADPAETLAGLLAAATGRDPRPPLAAVGAVGVSPHLAAGAPPALARAALDEELCKHAALAGIGAELGEAVEEAAGGSPEAGWRLAAAAEARNDALRGGSAAEEPATLDEEAAADHLQAFIDGQIWVKKKR